MRDRIRFWKPWTALGQLEKENLDYCKSIYAQTDGVLSIKNDNPSKLCYLDNHLKGTSPSQTGLRFVISG
jgi:hypothetical protein